MPDTNPTTPSPVPAPGTLPTPATKSAKPTGRRTLTPARLAALAHPPPRPGGPGRREIIAVFHRAVPALGVLMLRELIVLLIGCSPAQDWLGDGRPLVWVSNEWLCARLGIKEGQLKRLIGLAFERGLIAMRDSGDGHRRGCREKGESGRILWAYGFDLSPLAARYDEFAKLAADFEQKEAKVRTLKREISSLRRSVLTLADLGTAEMPGVADWSAIICRTHQVSAQTRGQRDPDVLQLLLDELTAMRDEAHARFEPNLPVETSQSDPAGSTERPLNTSTDKSISLKPFAEAHGQAQPRSGTPAPAAVPAPTTEPGDPLHGFSASPMLVMMIAPQFRDLVETSRPTRDNIVSVAWHVREHLGISQDAWAEACMTFGRWEAAVALAAITGRYNAGEVRSPGGLLRQMIKLYNTGDLRLDRTLRGLAARYASGEAQATAKPAPIGPVLPFGASSLPSGFARGGPAFEDDVECSASASTHDPRDLHCVKERRPAGTPYAPSDGMVELPATRKLP